MSRVFAQSRLFLTRSLTYFRGSCFFARESISSCYFHHHFAVFSPPFRCHHAVSYHHRFGAILRSLRHYFATVSPPFRRHFVANSLPLDESSYFSQTHLYSNPSRSTGSPSRAKKTNFSCSTRDSHRIQPPSLNLQYQPQI